MFRLFNITAATIAFVTFLLSCGISSNPAPITVYDSILQVSLPLPQGWRPEGTAKQAGFHMQSFTGPSVDVPERQGIRVQLMVGPMPANSTLDVLASRYIGQRLVQDSRPYDLYGFKGRTWLMISNDKEEQARLMLADVKGVLYGIYVIGEARTLQAFEFALSAIWSDFAIERSEFFEVYEAPGGAVTIRHPRSWERISSVAKPGQSLFVSFRSAPLAVETDGTSVHATLGVTVNRVEPDVTLETFYAVRVDEMGDNYRIIDHQLLDGNRAISTLYHIETQLSDFLERTIYVVRDGKSFVYSFNCRSRLYHAIEPWINEMVEGIDLG